MLVFFGIHVSTDQSCWSEQTGLPAANFHIVDYDYYYILHQDTTIRIFEQARRKEKVGETFQKFNVCSCKGKENVAMGCSSSRSLSNTSSPVTSSSSSHQCIPHPVFVIKTMNDSSDEKLFINVLILKDTSEIAASEVMISDPVTDVDRRSHRCHIVDFVCSPLIVEYPGNGNSSEFNPQFSKFCLWCIELTRDTLINRGVLGNMDTLSAKYSNPKVINNYKGKSIRMYDKSKVVTGVNFDGEAPNSKHHSEALEELRDEAIARRQSLEEAERRKQAIIASSTKVLSKDNDQRSVRSMDVENVHKAEGDLMAIKQDSIHLDLSDEEHDEAEPELELPSSMSTDAEATEIKTKGLPLSNAANFRYSDQSDGNGRESIQNKILQQGSEKFFSKNLGISASIFNKAKPSTTEAPKEKTNSGIDTKDSFWTNRSSSSESDMVKNVSVQGTVLREESEKLKGNATSSGGSNQSD